MSAARFPHFYPVMETMRSRLAMTSHAAAMTREGIAGVFDKQAADWSANKGEATFHGGRVDWNIEDKEVGMNQVTISYLWPMAYEISICNHMIIIMINYDYVNYVCFFAPDVC